MKKSTTFQNLVNSAQQNHESERAKAADCRVCQCHSPTTEAYLEETRLNGLPVIPFAFPTSVVAERLRQRKEKHAGDCDGGGAPAAGGAENKTLPQDIFRRNVSLASTDQLYPGEFDFGGPRSLENLVYIAQRELMSESLQPHEVMLPGAGASASSMETAGTAYSAASDDDEIASLHRNSRGGAGDSDDAGIVMVAPAAAQGDDPNKTPVVRPTRQDSGGYFEMAPPGKLSSFSPPKDRFPSTSPPPPRITARRHCAAAAAPVPQRASSARKTSSDDFFEMDFSGRS